ncbi:MAG: transcriptional regulator, partial [Firmicutes bacterium]|nr:transcriptional regulator [Bacillota bacterium]
MPAKRRLKRKLPFFLFITCCLLLLAGALLVAGELWLKLSGNGVSIDGNIGEASESINSMTVLLLGMDSRPGETIARTDTIIVAHLEPADDRLSLLSIPRDTR